MQNSAATVEDRMAVAQKIKQLPYAVATLSSSCTSTPRYTPKRIENNTFKTALFRIEKRWKRSKYPPTDEWLLKCGMYV